MCSEEGLEALKAKLWSFMKQHIYPNEQRFARECHEIGRSGNEWTDAPIMIELKLKAKALGLWNMFLPVDSAECIAQTIPDGLKGHRLNNRQYAEVCVCVLSVCA